MFPSRRDIRLLRALLPAVVLAIATAGCGNDPYSVPTGSITIVLEPAQVDAPWCIEGERGFRFEGTGNNFVRGLRPGRYTIVWGQAWGWAAPPPRTVEVTMAATATAIGTYRTATTVFPDTPDHVMTDFRLAYGNGDLSLLANLLHPDHITVLQQVTTDAFPAVGARLVMTEERRINQRMFSGQDLVDPEGQPVPALTSIWLSSFYRLGDWELSPATDPIPDVLCANYYVFVEWGRAWPHPAMRTQGTVKFYVTSEDTVVAGLKRPRYRVRGQMDLTSTDKRATENACWGSVKALFR